MGPLSTSHWVCYIFACVRGTQRLVLVGTLHALRLPLDVWYDIKYFTLIKLKAYVIISVLGFIMMTPQLFINYKLKSVAHLPWRMMTYKALNTFIDDIFAFVIKMPTLYRIGCLRDGELFLVV